MLCILKLHSDVCQLFFSKTEKKYIESKQLGFVTDPAA